MKKFFLFCAALVCVAVFVSCNGAKLEAAKSQNDSLMLALLQQQNEMAELVATLDAATQQLDEINGQINVNGEDQTRVSQRARLMQQLEAVQKLVADKQKELDKFKKNYYGQLSKNKVLQETVDRMTKEIEEYQAKITEYEAKIAEQAQQIDNLNTELTDTKEDLSKTREKASQQEVVINNQDKELNSGYYILDSKSNLKAMGLISGGLFSRKSLNQAGFDTSVFKKVDIRDVSVIKLESKSGKIVSPAPQGSYEFAKGEDGMMELRILDKEEFWSLSKYLVVII